MVGLRVCLPGSVPQLGEDTPEQGWAKDAASHLSSDPHTHPVWPSLPTQCPAVPWGTPLDRAGSCQCPVASTVGCYLHSCWGSCCRPPTTKVPPGTMQQLWLVLRCSGLCEPRCLSLVVALLCPSPLKAGTSTAELGQELGCVAVLWPEPWQWQGWERPDCLTCRGLSSDSPSWLSVRALAYLQVSCGR